MKNKKYLFFILGIIFLFLIWFILSLIFHNSLIIPSILDVSKALIKIFQEKIVYGIIFKTILDILLTVLLSFIIAIFLATLSYRFSNFKSFIHPIIILMKTIPIVAIIILFFMMIGIKATPYIVTSFVIIPILYEGILSGYQSLDKNMLEEIKTISSFNFLVLSKVYIPLCIPYIITSMIQSFGLGMKVMIMAEYMSPTNDTLGSQIRRHYNNNDMDKVFAWVIILIVFVSAVEIMIYICKKRIEPSIK